MGCRKWQKCEERFTFFLFCPGLEILNESVGVAPCRVETSGVFRLIGFAGVWALERALEKLSRLTCLLCGPFRHVSGCHPVEIATEQAPSHNDYSSQGAWKRLFGILGSKVLDLHGGPNATVCSQHTNKKRPSSDF